MFNIRYNITKGRNDTMSNKKLLERVAYYALLIVGVIFIVTAIINQLDVRVDFINSLKKFVYEIAILFMVIVVAFVGWPFAKTQKPVWRVIFFIAAILAIASSIMNVLT